MRNVLTARLHLVLTNHIEPPSKRGTQRHDGCNTNLPPTPSAHDQARHEPPKQQRRLSETTNSAEPDEPSITEAKNAKPPDTGKAGNANGRNGSGKGGGGARRG